MSKILYILGNGFDMALGMKTSYPDFYNYLSKLDDKDCSRLLKLMKNDVNMRKELWTDMEIALGKFTVRANNSEEFTYFYYELCDHLNDYLEMQVNDFKAKVSEKPKIKDLFFQDISDFSIFLKERDQWEFRRHIFDNCSFYIMSFNYTRVIESLRDLPSSSVNTSNVLNNLMEIIHVHGELDDTIIVGVDKKEQIDDYSIRGDVEVQNVIIKAKANEAMRTLRAYNCEEFINSADVIILYGVSFGETDEHWWKLIGNNFKSRDLILINHFYLKGVNAQRRRQLIANYENNQKLEFMKKLGFRFEVDWPKDTDNRLFFVTNANAFSMSKYLAEI